MLVLSGDGLNEPFVTELVRVQTLDSRRDGVYFFRNKRNGRFEKHQVTDGPGRTAYAALGSLKPTSTDLGVSVFGMYATGSLTLLKDIRFTQGEVKHAPMLPYCHRVSLHTCPVFQLRTSKKHESSQLNRGRCR